MLYIAIFIPLRLAFIDDSAVGWTIFDWIINGIFIIDLFVNCFSAYFDQNDNLITDKKVKLLQFTAVKILKQQKIFKEYLKGWFFIDVASIIPFDYFFQSSNQYHQLLRISRLPRLYKLFRVAKYWNYKISTIKFLLD